MTDRELRISADEAHSNAIRSIAELLGKLKIESAFVGEVAVGAWLGSPVERGSVDVLALVSPEGKNQIAMMASHRGFVVSREAIEAADELDLIPLALPPERGGVRVHVLIASNALYGRMIGKAVAASVDDVPARVVAAEDLALFLMLGEDEASKATLDTLLERERERFDVDGFNQRLDAIGLQRKRMQR